MARPKKEVVEQAVEDQQDVNPEEMTEEEIAEFNAQEEAIRQKMLDQQEQNRQQKTVATERDPNVIRGIKGPDRIRCVTVRKVGLNDPTDCTSDIDEPVDIPRTVARRLQDAGAIKVEV